MHEASSAKVEPALVKDPQVGPPHVEELRAELVELHVHLPPPRTHPREGTPRHTQAQADL